MKKTAIISSEKPTGHQTLSLFTFFNILIYDVDRNLKKELHKNFKYGENLELFFGVI